MDNETKLSQQQIKDITESFKNSSNKDNTDTEAFIEKHLNQAQAQKLREVLKNPEKLNAILNSPAAQKFIEKFSKGTQ